jgi:hypothetical protein
MAKHKTKITFTRYISYKVQTDISTKIRELSKKYYTITQLKTNGGLLSTKWKYRRKKKGKKER